MFFCVSKQASPVVGRDPQPRQLVFEDAVDEIVGEPVGHGEARERIVRGVVAEKPLPGAYPDVTVRILRDAHDRNILPEGGGNSVLRKGQFAGHDLLHVGLPEVQPRPGADPHAALRVAEERRDLQRPQFGFVIGAEVAREASRGDVERQQAVERADPQRAVAAVEQRIAAVVDRDRSVDRVVARAPRRNVHRTQAPGMGADPHAPAAVGKHALDVVRQQGAIGGVELRETPRAAVVEVHAVVVGADPEALRRGVLDDTAHRIVAQRIAHRIVAQDAETPGQRVIVAHAAVVGPEPDAPLGVDEDGTDRIVAQRPRVGGMDVTFEASALRVADRKPVEGPDPETPSGVGFQHPDVVRNQPGIRCGVIASGDLQRAVETVEAVAVGGDPVSVAVGDDAGDVVAGHLRQDAHGVAVCRGIGVDAVGGPDEESVARGTDGVYADAREVGPDFELAALAVEEHDAEIGGENQIAIGRGGDVGDLHVAPFEAEILEPLRRRVVTRQSRRRADPEQAPVGVERVDGVVAQALRIALHAAEHRERITVVAVQPVLRAHPDTPHPVLRNGQHGALRQSFVDRQRAEFDGRGEGPAGKNGKKCEQEKRRFEFQHIVEAWEAKYTFFFGKSEPPGRFSVPETPPPGVRNVRRQVRMRRQRTEAGTTSTSSRAGSPRRRTTVLPAVSDAGVL